MVSTDTINWQCISLHLLHTKIFMLIPHQTQPSILWTNKHGKVQGCIIVVETAKCLMYNQFNLHSQIYSLFFEPNVWLKQWINQ